MIHDDVIELPHERNRRLREETEPAAEERRHLEEFGLEPQPCWSAR